MLDNEPIRFEPLVIFAADNPDVFEADKLVAFKRMEGCYAGTREPSFVIRARAFPLVKPYIVGQESVLWLAPQPPARSGLRTAWLVYQDRIPERLGKLVANPANTEAGFTFDPETGIRWGIKPDCGPDPRGLSSVADLAEAIRNFTGPMPNIAWGAYQPEPALCGNKAGFEHGWEC